MQFHPCGCATGIGSLPHLDPTAAVSLIKEFLPLMPHWPQLPRYSGQEFFSTQFLQVLSDLGLLRVERGTKAHFLDEEPDWPERLAEFYELYIQAAEGNLDALNKFSFPPGSAEGFYRFYDELIGHGTDDGEARYLKGQIVGLLSVGFQVTNQRGIPAYYDEQLRDVLLKQLSLQAAWQVKTLSEFGLPVIIFMDDPVIDSCGRFDRISVSKDQVQAELFEFVDFVRRFGGLAGVHSCSDLDWTILFGANLDIISFDTYQFAESFALYAASIDDFIKDGGVVAWGVVPTDGKALREENIESLSTQFRKYITQLADKGVDPQLIYTQSLITPACGAGTLTTREAERIYQLTGELARNWERCF
ncbi:MAG TPA: hypothetical protein GXX59_08260 [Syntrophomonadaceae bacterium]|nr:hypothetical protein [Syntrophomonadaceae bacterium]